MEEKFIGNYKILKEIGAGGMARVYLAVHKEVPNLKVVLKILSDSRMVERFRQEADKLALLDGHPHICQIKHFFSHGDEFVIAMEHIEGITIDEMIKGGAKFPVSEAARIIAEVLATLESAHQKDIYHRDIKPSNIMIDKTGNVKIIDFGIAKGKTDPDLTVAGSACGTPAYMAPEQFTPTEDIDYALVDIYAVGSTFYRMLTGKLPFKGDNEFAIRDAKLFSVPPRSRTLNPDIPARLDEIILKSLNKDPSERFQSARDMREMILPFSQEKRDVALGRADAVSVSGERKKSKRLALIVGTVIILIAAAVAIYRILPTERDTALSRDRDSREAVTESERGISEGTESNEGTINIEITPYGDVYMDDVLVGEDIKDTILMTDTGLHVVRVENKAAAKKTRIDTISLNAGRELPLRFAFQVREPQPAVSETVRDTGKVLIGSKPRGADIYIDGVFQKYQTPYTFTLEEGKHIVRIKLKMMGESMEKVDTVVVRKGGTHRVFFDAE
jgi:serine/threonine protein kinase